MDTFFGGGKIGEALGGSIAGIGALARGDVEQARTIAQDQPRPREIAGDLLKTGTTLASTATAPLGLGAKTFAGKLAGGAATGGLQGFGDRDWETSF